MNYVISQIDNYLLEIFAHNKFTPSVRLCISNAVALIVFEMSQYRIPILLLIYSVQLYVQLALSGNCSVKGGK